MVAMIFIKFPEPGKWYCTHGSERSMMLGTECTKTIFRQKK